jgi:hypothetical protein
MAKYRKKPVVIEAVQWTGTNQDEIAAFAPGIACFSDIVPPDIELHPDHRVINGVLSIVTLEGTMLAAIGDWIIKGVKGEFYPCKPDIFEATYEPA